MPLALLLRLRGMTRQVARGKAQRLHRVMHLVEVLQVIPLVEVLLLQVRAQVQLLHLRSLLQLQIQIQPPALHRAAPLVRATDAI